MPEEQNSTNQTISAAAELVKAIPVYQDIAQPAAKEVGKNLLVVSKTISMALAPLKLLVWGYEQVEDYLTRRVTEKLSSIPQENIVTPDPKIVGPAIEALRYIGAEEDIDIREMYASLIANAMNVDKKDFVHPAYVDILKNISSDEALILRCFIDDDIFPMIDIKRKHENGGTTTIMHMFSNIGKMAGIPELRLGATPKYLTNLIRLGLFDSPNGVFLVNDDLHYKPLIALLNLSPDKEKEIEFDKRIVQLTPFGRDFIKTVII